MQLVTSSHGSFAPHLNLRLEPCGDRATFYSPSYFGKLLFLTFPSYIKHSLYTLSMASPSSPPIPLPRTGREAASSDDTHKDADAHVFFKQQYAKDAEASVDMSSRASIVSNSVTRRLLRFGVEEVGVHPIPEVERTDVHVYKVFTLWIAMSISVLP